MDIIVKTSPIHGRGVFAARPFKKGETVLSWDASHKLSAEQVQEMSEEEKDYVSLLDGHYTLMQSPERYVNHSCEPNTEAKDSSDVAIRDIAAGEEITSDYATEMVPGTEMSCACGSKHCRKTIRHA